MNLLKFKTAIESKRLIIKEPSTEMLLKVQISSTRLGDSFCLSETDKEVLALALELKASGKTPKIVSDDYSIQNVATELNIGFISQSTQGIRRLLKWTIYCPACYKNYPANHKSNECDICGTILKRKPIRRLKTVT